MARPSPLIALISATPTAIAPAVASISEQLPHARVWNILDDRLLIEANAVRGITPQLTERMNRLISHALIEGADGVLLTCSMYGPVAQAYSSDVPVLAPDDAGFTAVINSELPRVLIVASFEAALTDTTTRFNEVVRERGAAIQMTGTVAPGALDAANAVDHDALLTALRDACRPFIDSVDAIFLAQYSLAPATVELASWTGLPVFSGPASAAEFLRDRLAISSEAS